MEEGEDRIAHELQHLSAGCDNWRDDTVEIAIEQLQDALGR